MWIIILLVLIPQLTTTQSVDTIPSKILLMFPTSRPIVIHYENTTSYIINSIFTQGFNRIIYFVNHNVFDNFLRPNSESVLNVVVLNNQNLFLRYSLTDYNIQQEDVVFFIEENIIKPNGSVALWKSFQQTIWTNVLIYILKKEELYYCCYCCGKKSKILQKTSLTQLPFLIKTFRICYDFNGVVFKVAYIVYEPFFWCK